MGENGGKRIGAGRPKGAWNHDRREFIALINKIGKPEELIANLKKRADGVLLSKATPDGGREVFEMAPDIDANKYLLDQLHGKAKQSLDMSVDVRTVEDDLDELPE